MKRTHPPRPWQPSPSDEPRRSVRSDGENLQPQRQQQRLRLLQGEHAANQIPSQSQ